MDLAIKGELEGLIGQVEAGGDLVVDLTDVEFMDLHGVHALERVAEQISRLTVANATGKVRRLLDLTGFSSRPDITVLP
jgi:anti-anti-sigma factor